MGLIKEKLLLLAASAAAGASMIAAYGWTDSKESRQ